MKLKEWKQLSDEDRVRLCQQLDPMKEWDLFKKVERAFLKELAGQASVETAFCGICGTVGPLNGISVKMRAGPRVTRLPKYFMGFPVIRVRRR